MYLKTIFLSIILFVALLTAQDEFLVNTYLPDAQRDVHVGRDAQGNFVVVWQSQNQVSDTSSGDIYFQLFNSDRQKIGGEVLVNQQTEGEQIKPALAIDAAGDFIVAWQTSADTTSVYDIKARLYKNNVPAGNEFTVNGTTRHAQVNPEVAIAEDGRFLIVWESWFQDGSNKGVYAQLFNAQGEKEGPEFQVNTTTQFSQARPVVRFFPDGRFVVVWESWKQDVVTPSGYGLYGQIFDATGNKIGGEFQINTYTNDYQWFGDIEILNDDEFVVAWCSWEQDGDDGGIYFQMFDGNGQKTGTETRVNINTKQYQWLPKVRRLQSGNLAFVWSSWRQDGSREGVYCRVFDTDGHALTLESRVNDYTDSFQWEPDFIPAQADDFIVFWSSWGQYGADNDYDVIGKEVTPVFPAGRLDPLTYEQHGRSSAHIVVHVMDSSAVTGDRYEVSFKVFSSDSILSSIKNMNSGQTLINDFSLSKGNGVFYLTPTFEGVAVEYFPRYTLRLDMERSHFYTPSGSNLQLKLGVPAAGSPRLAPIDVQLLWNDCDTLADGNYAQPADTAMGIDGVRDVVTPFRAWNITDSAKIDLLVMDQDVKENNRWDPGERIIMLTPDPYKQSGSDTYAQLDVILPEGNVQLPKYGDKYLIYTLKPLTNSDKYYFESNLANLTGISSERSIQPEKVELAQNYPNPFNGYTTIKYYLPHSGRVRITVFNVLGQRVLSLADGFIRAGRHKILIDANKLASGIYFYSIRYENRLVTRKMVLIR